MLRRIRYNSPVILTFALLSLFALVMNRLTGGVANMRLFSVYRSSLRSPLTYLRFFTHVLGHSGWQHYINNTLLLLVIGPSMEDKYGSGPLLGTMALTAFISGLVQFIFFPGTALLGASGIVFMLIILSSLSGVKSGTIPLTLILVAVFYIGGEIIDGLFLRDNVSQLTHVIGGVCGGAFGLVTANGRRRKK